MTAVAGIVPGEWPKWRVQTWRVRLLYRYFVVGVLSVVAAVILWLMIRSIEVAWVGMGVVVGFIMAIGEYVFIRRRAKHGDVMFGLTFIYYTEREQWIWFIIFLAGVMILGSVLTAVLHPDAQDSSSFLLGVLGSLCVLLPVVGYLLETRLGKLCVLLK